MDDIKMEEYSMMEYIDNSGTVEALLTQWGLNKLIPIFSEKSVDIETLRYLTLEDICVLIPIEHFALRVKFRQKLFEWRLEMEYASPLADTQPLNNTFVKNWLTTLPSTSTPSISEESSNTDKATGEGNIQNKQHLDLQNILRLSLTGKKLLLQTNLTTFYRRKLVEIICEHWLNNDIHPKNADFRYAAKQICILFAKEDKEIYIGTNSARGILIQKYYTLSQKFRSAGIIKSLYKTKKVKIGEKSVNSWPKVKTEVINDEILVDFEWLRDNKTPEHLVIDKWNNSFQFRQQQREQNIDLFLEWPILKQTIGSQLIELDFERQFPSKSKILFSKWDNFVKRVRLIYRDGIKDNASKQILRKLDDDISINKDSKDFYYTILLNAILIPTIIKFKKDVTPKLVWKPTIADGQNGLAIFVKNIKDVPMEIRSRKEKNVGKSLAIHPFIVIVGDCKDKIESSCIYYNDVFYECGSFLKALSLCFQIHKILNIQYARECIQVWHFMELYFFDFPVSGNKSNSLIGLINDLKN